MSSPTPVKSPTDNQRSIRTRFVAVLATLLVFATILVPATVSAQSASDEATFISLINQVRTNNGLAPLAQDSELTNLSRNWTAAQRDGVCGLDEDGEQKHICHANPISEGVTSNWRKLGENVGTGPSVNAVMDAFIASPGHYANIIDPAFTHIGVGVVWDGNRLYTTHRFMRLDQATSDTTTTTAAPPTTSPPTSAAQTTVAPTTAAPTSAAPANNTASNNNTSSNNGANNNGSGNTVANNNGANNNEQPNDLGLLDPESLNGEPAEDVVTEDSDARPVGSGQVNVDEARASVLISALALDL